MFTALEAPRSSGRTSSANRSTRSSSPQDIGPTCRNLSTLGIEHDRGVSRHHRGLGFVGLEWQRSLSSATLRGVGRDAFHVVRRLFR
ncbi:hypothetical protein [Lentzea sp. CC55]|uniref:hypothetical protein n=1 Tax=Lentzea sp. CC55 TaxID=2884909 RepID=UPI001F2C7180|nr:hypothetical protein [Lentzea sp. CC55]MCG8927445.1 hypothetical protein [Lentzea sp. CC55]